MDADWLDQRSAALADRLADIGADDPDRADLLCAQGLLLLERQSRFGAADGTGDAAVAIWHQVVELTGRGRLPAADRLHFLADAHLQRYQAAHEAADLDEAIERQRAAVKTAGILDTRHVRWLSDLAKALRIRYAQTSDLADLDQAIEALGRILGLTARGSADFAGVHSNLGLLWRQRHARTGRPGDLERAVEHGLNALHVDEPDLVETAHRLLNLAGALDLLPGVDDPDGAEIPEAAVDAAFDLLDRAAAGSAESDLVMAAFWRVLSLRLRRSDTALPRTGAEVAELADAVWAQHRDTDSLALLDTAIDLRRLLLAMGVRDEGAQASTRTSLAALYVRRFERTGHDSDLTKADKAITAALRHAPSAGSGNAALLTALGNVRMRQWRRSGDQTVLDEAVRSMTRAADLIGVDDAFHAESRANLAAAFSARFASTGDPEDLERSIAAGRAAVAAADPRRRERSSMLLTLSDTLRIRYELRGELPDLQEAVTLTQQAIVAAGDRPIDLARARMALAIALAVRAEALGTTKDLDEAITAGRAAVTVLPSGDLRQPEMLSNLALMLRLRFEWAGQPEDIDDAIELGLDGLRAAALDDRNRAALLLSTSLALRLRAEYHGDVGDLREAITTAAAAVDASAWSPVLHAACHNNLGSLYDRLYDRTGEIGHLDTAADEMHAAVQLTREDSPFYVRYLANYGQILRERYVATGDPAVLARAREAAASAVRLAGDTQHSAMFLGGLARIDLEHFRLHGDQAALDEAVSNWQRGSEATSAAASTRAHNARSGATAAADAGRIAAAADAYRSALALLPQVAWHGLTRPARERLLADWSGLAGEAASVMLMLDRPDDAVEALTLGRTVVWSQILDARQDRVALAERAPELAARLDAVRRRLDTGEHDTSRLYTT